MSAPVIVVSPAELAELVRAAVREALDEHGVTAANVAPPPAEWLDAKGAAKLLGVHVRTVGNLAAPGPNGELPKLPSSRVGRLLRFRRTAVLAFLEQPSALRRHG
jgi:excisionase family DNA binding protein